MYANINFAFPLFPQFAVTVVVSIWNPRRTLLCTLLRWNYIVFFYCIEYYSCKYDSVSGSVYPMIFDVGKIDARHNIPLINGNLFFERLIEEGGKFAGKYLQRIDPLEWREHRLIGAALLVAGHSFFLFRVGKARSLLFHFDRVGRVVMRAHRFPFISFSFVLPRRLNKHSAASQCTHGTAWNLIERSRFSATNFYFRFDIVFSRSLIRYHIQWNTYTVPNTYTVKSDRFRGCTQKYIRIFVFFHCSTFENWFSIIDLRTLFEDSS